MRTPAQIRAAEKYQAKKREYVNSTKIGKPCMDCGGMFPPVCMDYDHRPGEAKLFSLAQSHTVGIDRIDVEIAKCDLVCANCHRIRTHIGRPEV